MQAEELIRVVTLRKGKLKPSEFKLREGEQGLSLFAHAAEPSPAKVMEAVRAGGKQGELAVAMIAAREIRALGLALVQTPGGTTQEEVNAIHYEARLSILRKLILRLRGLPPHEFFNEHMSPKLYARARVLD